MQFSSSDPLGDFGCLDIISIPTLKNCIDSCWDHVRTDIVEYIISELGILERMDKQIRAAMSEMLMRNLANVERATGSLVDSLGEGSAETVDEESS